METQPEDEAKCVEQFKEWFNQQSHLSKDIDETFLRRFAHSCYYDLEKTKKTAETFFTLRSAMSELLINRDPNSAPIQKILKIINLGHYTISKNRCLWVWQINDPGLENYDYILDTKLFFLTTDAHFLEDDYLANEDIVLLDVKDITLKLLVKLNLSIARKLEKYQEEAMPIRLKQIHVVNAPPFIDKIYSVMKAFMKRELTEMVHFHTPKSDTLFKYLDKEDLPADFGGNLISLADYKANTISLLARNREKLLNENLWRLVENSKNKKKNQSSDITSFRSLAID